MGRGGRGGRGGPGRGGAATRGRSALPRGSTNGHFLHTDGKRPSSVPPANATPKSTDASQLGGEDSIPTESHDQQNGLTASISTSTDTSSRPETSTLATSISTNSSAWGATDSFSAETSVPTPVTNIPVSKPASKTPATSKLSWAQIARFVLSSSKLLSLFSPSIYRPWEKPAIPQPPPPVNVSQCSPEPESQAEVQEHSREEPTTAEAPTWDDEPVTQVNGPEAWPLTVEPVLESPTPEPPTASVVAEVKSEVVDGSFLETQSITDSKPEEPTRAPVQVMPVTSPLPAQITPIPSPKLTTRPSAHRTGARYKVTDQPVTMPVSFGTVEKLDMQFGSLSIGGNSTNESAS